MDVIVVVDIQVGLLRGAPKYDLPRVIDRINSLTVMVRGQSGNVVWIRHRGDVGEDFEPGTAGWSFLPELDHQPDDIVSEKTLNDPFAGTAWEQRCMGSIRIGSLSRDGPLTSASTRWSGHRFRTIIGSWWWAMVTR